MRPFLPSSADPRSALKNGLPAMDDRDAVIRVAETLAANYRHKRNVTDGLAESDHRYIETVAEFLFCSGAINYPYLERARAAAKDLR